MGFEQVSVLKIAVVEDHTLFREALCAMIDTWEYCKVVIRASNGNQLFERISSRNIPDIVITDLYMPEMNGYETVAEVNRKYKQTKILVVSQYHSEEMLIKLIKTGIHGYLYKNDDPIILKNAIWTIFNDGYYFTDNTASNLIKNAIRTGQFNFKDELTEEELLFLCFICSDKSYKEIADTMGIPTRHIDYIRNGLFDRFEVKSRTGLAITAIKKGLSQYFSSDKIKNK